MTPSEELEQTRKDILNCVDENELRELKRLEYDLENFISRFGDCWNHVLDQQVPEYASNFREFAR